MIGALATATVVSQAWSREYDLRMEADRQRAAAITARDQTQAAWHQALQAEALAEKSRQHAEAEAILSQTSLQFLEHMIESSDPVSWVLHASLGPISQSPNLADWLEAASERARTELVNQPRIQARVFDTLANGCRSLGKYDKAKQLLDQSEIIRNTLASTGKSSEPAELIRHQFYRGVLYQDLHDLTQAERLLQAALESSRSLRRSQPLLEADISFHLGLNASLARRFDVAQSHFQQALQIRQQVCPADSSLVKAAQVACELCNEQGDHILSLPQLQALVGGNDLYSRLVQDYLKVLAWRQFEKWGSAAAAYKPVLDQLASALPPKHPLLILAHGEYAELCWRAGDFRQALPAIEETIRLAEEVEPEHVRLRQVREIYGAELLRSLRYENAGRQFQLLIERDLSVGDRFSHVAAEGMIWVKLMTNRKQEGLEQAKDLVSRTQHLPSYQQAWYQYQLARAAMLNGEASLTQTADVKA